MNSYRIKIQKAGKEAFHAVVTAPRISEAEYYVVEVLILGSRVSMEDHFKMNYVPLARSLKRTSSLSRFEFASRMLTENKSVIAVDIQEETRHKTTSKGSVYVRQRDQDIFSLWPYDEYVKQEKKRRETAPPFFTKNDIDYFTSVAGKKFKSPSDDFIAIGEELTKRGVVLKTAYWAQLMRESGYATEFRQDWQAQKTIRYYTWARVFPGKKSPNVFFTIGAGSRLDEVKGQVSGLVYKLDCRRDSLTPDQQAMFDNYIATHAPDVKQVEIDATELAQLNWELLADRTKNFMISNDSHFWKARRLVEGNVDHIPAMARVCWNTNKWVFPSGPAGKSNSQASTHEKDKGYGYEEWLFNTTRQIDGYHYSFLQCFHKGDHVGKKYDVRLYSFYDTGKGVTQYWIGRIMNIEVLTSEQAKFALHEYKKRKWYDEMEHQLRLHNIDGFNFSYVSETDIFNVRFKVDSSSIEQYPMPVPVAVHEKIGNQHYTLVELEGVRAAPAVKDPFEGSDIGEPDDDTPSETTINAAFQGHERVMKLLHRDIQRKIRRQLMTAFKDSGHIVQKEYKTEFGTSIDLVVKEPNGDLTLYEIKTNTSAVACIREAIGQLIEYCFYPQQRFAKKLIVVGLDRADHVVRTYIAHLSAEMNINLEYQRFDLESGLLETGPS